jgi:hypothetical protein
LYGPLSSISGSYTVSLDGGPPSLFTPHAPLDHPQTLLYHAAQLGGGQHKIDITFNGTQGQRLAVDFAQVVNVEQETYLKSSPLSWISPGEFVGIIIGSCVVTSILTSLLFLICIYRKNKRLRSSEKAVLVGSTITPFPPPSLASRRRTYQSVIDSIRTIRRSSTLRFSSAVSSSGISSWYTNSRRGGSTRVANANTEGSTTSRGRRSSRRHRGDASAEAGAIANQAVSIAFLHVDLVDEMKQHYETLDASPLRRPISKIESSA